MVSSGSFWRITLASAAAVVLLSVAAFGWRHFRPLPRLAQIRQWVEGGRWDLADAAIRDYLSRGPRDPEALLLGARITGMSAQATRLRVQQIEAELQRLAKIEDASGTDLEQLKAVHGQAGELKRKGEELQVQYEKQLQQCVALLDQVPSNAVQKPEALLRQGQALRELGYGRRAEQAWRAILELPRSTTLPQRQIALAELLSVCQVERRVSEGVGFVWEMYPNHREKWRLLITLGRLQGRGLQPDRAILLLEPVIERDPTDTDARRALARYQISLFEWKKAQEQAERCLELDPSDTRSREILLECYLAEQSWDAMDEILAQPDLDFSSATLWRLRARRREAADDFKQAEAYYREALRLKPSDAVTHHQLAQMLVRTDRRDDAQAHFEEFRKLQEHEQQLELLLKSYTADEEAAAWKVPAPAMCVEMAEHCQGLGRLDEARAWLQEALRQRPDHVEARARLEALSKSSG